MQWSSSGSVENLFYSSFRKMNNIHSIALTKRCVISTIVTCVWMYRLIHLFLFSISYFCKNIKKFFIEYDLITLTNDILSISIVSYLYSKILNILRLANGKLFHLCTGSSLNLIVAKLVSNDRDPSHWKLRLYRTTYQCKKDEITYKL